MNETKPNNNPTFSQTVREKIIQALLAKDPTLKRGILEQQVGKVIDKIDQLQIKPKEKSDEQLLVKIDELEIQALAVLKKTNFEIDTFRSQLEEFRQQSNLSQVETAILDQIDQVLVTVEQEHRQLAIEKMPDIDEILTETKNLIEAGLEILLDKLNTNQPNSREELVKQVQVWQEELIAQMFGESDISPRQSVEKQLADSIPWAEIHEQFSKTQIKRGIANEIPLDRSEELNQKIMEALNKLSDSQKKEIQIITNYLLDQTVELATKNKIKISSAHDDLLRYLFTTFSGEEMERLQTVESISSFNLGKIIKLLIDYSPENGLREYRRLITNVEPSYQDALIKYLANKLTSTEDYQYYELMVFCHPGKEQQLMAGILEEHPDFQSKIVQQEQVVKQDLLTETIDQFQMRVINKNDGGSRHLGDEVVIRIFNELKNLENSSFFQLRPIIHRLILSSLGSQIIAKHLSFEKQLGKPTPTMEEFQQQVDTVKRSFSKLPMYEGNNNNQLCERDGLQVVESIDSLPQKIGFLISFVESWLTIQQTDNLVHSEKIFAHYRQLAQAAGLLPELMELHAELVLTFISLFSEWKKLAPKNKPNNGILADGFANGVGNISSEGYSMVILPFDETNLFVKNTYNSGTTLSTFIYSRDGRIPPQIEARSQQLGQEIIQLLTEFEKMAKPYQLQDELNKAPERKKRSPLAEPNATWGVGDMNQYYIKYPDILSQVDKLPQKELGTTIETALQKILELVNHPIGLGYEMIDQIKKWHSDKQALTLFSSREKKNEVDEFKQSIENWLKASRHSDINLSEIFDQSVDKIIEKIEKSIINNIHEKIAAELNKLPTEVFLQTPASLANEIITQLIKQDGQDNTIALPVAKEDLTNSNQNQTTLQELSAPLGSDYNPYRDYYPVIDFIEAVWKTKYEELVKLITKIVKQINTTDYPLILEKLIKDALLNKVETTLVIDDPLTIRRIAFNILEDKIIEAKKQELEELKAQPNETPILANSAYSHILKAVRQQLKYR